MSANLTTNMRKTTDAFVAAWETWKVDPILAVRAPECVMIQRPASLGIPARNNEEFRKWFEGVEGLLINNKVFSPEPLVNIVVLTESLYR